MKINLSSVEGILNSILPDIKTDLATTVVDVLQAKVMIPESEIPAALADTAKFTANGQPLTEDEFKAAVEVYFTMLAEDAVSQIKF